VNLLGVVINAFGVVEDSATGRGDVAFCVCELMRAVAGKVDVVGHHVAEIISVGGVIAVVAADGIGPGEIERPLAGDRAKAPLNSSSNVSFQLAPGALRKSRVSRNSQVYAQMSS
jgi:hypothetical protein